jgi:hypothetical protein
MALAPGRCAIAVVLSNVFRFGRVGVGNLGGRFGEGDRAETRGFNLGSGYERKYMPL